MDHISKALERAKAEHRSVRDWVRPDRPASVRERLPTLDRLEGKVLQPDIDHLRAHHLLCGAKIDDPVITDKYRLLRTRVLQLMNPRRWTRLGITSPAPKAGKTMNAINLALSIARDGNHNVLLIDLDLRRPAVANALGIEPEAGIVDYLSGAAELKDVLVQLEGFERISILPGREVDADPDAPDLLRSTRMQHLLKKLNDRDESLIAIVDLPPVLVGDDVIAVAPLLDSMLLIIEEGGTELQELTQTAELLADFNLLGTVLNKSTERTKEVAGYYQAYHG